MMAFPRLVILSSAKDLNTLTNAFQILHFVQNDTIGILNIFYK